MKHRKLRIAWSVAWGIAAVLLVALWVRSYWKRDTAYFPLSSQRMILLHSSAGRIGMGTYLPSVFLNSPRTGIVHTGWGTDTHRQPPASSAEALFGGGSDQYDTYIKFPHWTAVLLVAALAGLPWRRWRWNFSLRTLLLATTLVAVGLGLIVWTIR